MGFKKCPRCELNYILDTETLCKVCRREIRGEDRSEDVELCSMCNERPAMHGKDVCYICYKEMEENGEIASEEENRPEEDETVELDSIDDTSDLIDDETDDIPEVELEEIENDLSLDELEEEEEAMDDEAEDDDRFEE